MLHTSDFSLQRTTEWLSALWHTAENEQYPAALWRLPYQSDRHLIIHFAENASRVKVDLEELPAGFVFSPFLNESGEQTYFLKADLHWQFSLADAAFPTEENLTISPECRAEGEAFLRRAEHYQPESFSTQRRRPPEATQEPGEADRKRSFEQLVGKAVERIREGDFQKVVLSRRAEVTLPAEFEVIRTFERLCALYPHAFVSLVSIPGVGVWIGASPETLISVDKHQIFRTVALAGTQAARPGMSVNDARWGHKEIEEQALVGRYIISCFKKIRLREYEEQGPRTFLAGNLMHLKTDYAVDTQAVNFPQLGSVMLELLHPTSAVCGMPKPAALNFIRKFEGYDREFYSGYLGPVNVGQETNLFVNLRCLRLFDTTAWVYAGAGITAESVPEQEWLETQMKCQTMLKVLQ